MERYECSWTTMTANKKINRLQLFIKHLWAVCAAARSSPTFPRFDFIYQAKNEMKKSHVLFSPFSACTYHIPVLRASTRTLHPIGSILLVIASMANWLHSLEFEWFFFYCENKMMHFALNIEKCLSNNNNKRFEWFCFYMIFPFNQQSCSRLMEITIYLTVFLHESDLHSNCFFFLSFSAPSLVQFCIERGKGV